MYISNAKDEDEEKLFSTTCAQVHMCMVLARISFEDQLAKLTTEQAERYAAFELGVLEFYDRAVLQIGLNEKDSGVRFINFMIYYAHYKNAELAESVFQFWLSLVKHGLLLRERKLGFDSVNDEVNPDGSRKIGHSPIRYFANAVGLKL